MSTPSIFSFPSKEASPENPAISAGDAMVVIRPNGDVFALACGVDAGAISALEDKDPEDMTEAEQALLHQGNMMFLLTMCAQSPVLMNILAEVANAPGVLNLEKIKTVVTRH